MDSIYDLLAGKNFDEPPEVAKIKQFVRDNYKADSQVTVRERDIVVSVASASLAGRLRFDMQRLIAALETKKRIIVRIARS
jgi:hypothetical protein